MPGGSSRVAQARARWGPGGGGDEFGGTERFYGGGTAACDTVLTDTGHDTAARTRSARRVGPNPRAPHGLHVATENPCIG